jgi:hypothetical protein
MSYRLPPSQVLAVAISNALREHTTISSQRHFTALVRDKLRSIDPCYAVTEERVRREAIKHNLVKVAIQTRETEIKSKGAKCPVCGTRMRRVRNKTIYGGAITLGHRCPRCPFSMGLKKRVPVRYVFTDAIPRHRAQNHDGTQSTL